MKVFDSVPVKVPNKNVFNLSHDVKASYNFDKLYPIMCHPVYPGDTFNVSAEVFMRSMPLLAPVLHNVDLHCWFFFVPNRIVFNENKKRDWKVFITGGEDGKVSSDPSVEGSVPLPSWTYSQLARVNGDLAKHGSLLDHMGFPSINEDDTLQSGYTDRISVLPFRAYQCIYNEYFRNQNVQNEIEFSYDCGSIADDDVTALFSFRKKCWEKDYFTSCLPFAQRGEAVTLPITLEGLTASGNLTGTSSVDTGRLTASTNSYGIVTKGTDSAIGLSVGHAAEGAAVTLEGTSTITSGTMSFTGASIGTINDFRYCLRLQQWLENNARCGSRYIEQLFSHFGVRSSDARLQRPELLGGGKIPIMFTDVEQNSFGSGASSNVLGDLGGKGTLYGKTSGFKKYFEEHGILMGLISIIPRTSYCQGLPRYWSAMDKTDWYFPEFAHLGEQAVLNKEIYLNPAELQDIDNTPDDVFGYQGRFTELRYIPSSVHGELKEGLKYWHFGRIFDSLPVLNSDFVEAQSRVDCFALTSVSQTGYDPFVAQIHLNVKAVRPMPKFAVPTI